MNEDVTYEAAAGDLVVRLDCAENVDRVATSSL